MAARFKTVVQGAGGSQIWIKHPFASSPTKPDSALQVLATPTAYRAVVSAVHRESERYKVDLRVESTPSSSHEVNLNVSRHGQRIIRIHLREVPRLLRAAIVIDDMGHDLDAAHKLLALSYP